MSQWCSFQHVDRKALTCLGLRETFLDSKELMVEYRLIPIGENMSRTKITCKVGPGLFANEYYVMVNGSAAYYVNRDDVQVDSAPRHGELVNGVVNGYIVQEEGEKILIQVPGEAIVGGMRTWVERTELAA
jgi:hypothetical protein